MRNQIHNPIEVAESRLVALNGRRGAVRIASACAQLPPEPLSIVAAAQCSTMAAIKGVRRKIINKLAQARPIEHTERFHLCLCLTWRII